MQAQRVAFNVTAAGSGTLSYQWRRNGLPIAGANAAEFVIPSAASANEGLYTVAVSNNVGSVISQSAALQVNIAPSITRAPGSKTALSGSTVSFTVTATGTAPLSYQWLKNEASIAGATSSVLLLTNVQTGDMALYRVQVKNAAGTVVSANAGLTVQTVPQIVDLRGPAGIRAGETASLSVVAIGTRQLVYQWRFNGINIPNATNAALSLTNVTLGSSGDYTVTVSNDAGAATSSVLKLVVTENTVVLAAGVQASEFVIELTGPSGKQADVEATTTLDNWSNAGTVTFTNGRATFRQPIQAGGIRFYRTRIRP